MRLPAPPSTVQTVPPVRQSRGGRVLSGSQGRPAGGGVDRHGEGIQDVAPEEPIQLPERGIVDDQGERADRGARHVQGLHRDLDGHRASGHTEEPDREVHALGRRLGLGTHPIQIWRPQDEFVEQSSDDIWRAVCTAVRTALDLSGLGPEAIAGIGFDATCSLVLLDADFEHSTRVIDRLVSRIENYEFPTALRIAVGAACYPTHAVDATSLKRQAMSRPLVNWRGGHQISADHH